MLRNLMMSALITACCPAAAADVKYPFIGGWDCEVAEFTFTPEMYNNGSEDMPILEIEKEAQDAYTLTFADDYKVSLSGISKNRMHWASSFGEDLYECKRLK